MADNLSDMARSSLTVEIKGKSYSVAPLTIDDLAAFESHVRSERFKGIREACSELDPEQRIETFREFLAAGLSDADLVADMSSMSGVRFLLYRALRNNAGVELQNMGDLVDLSNLAEMADIVQSRGGSAVRPPQQEEQASE